MSVFISRSTRCTVKVKQGPCLTVDRPSVRPVTRTCPDLPDSTPPKQQHPKRPGRCGLMETDWICKELREQKWDAQEGKERQHEENGSWHRGRHFHQMSLHSLRSASRIRTTQHTQTARDYKREKKKARQKQEKAEDRQRRSSPLAMRG